MNAYDTMLTMDNPLSYWVSATDRSEQPRCPACGSEPDELKTTGLAGYPDVCVHVFENHQQFQR